MTRFGLIFAVFFWFLGAEASTAQPSAEKILPMDGHFNAFGTKVELNWFDAEPPRVGSVTVKRRLYGQTEGQTWQTIASALGPVMRYADTTIRPGVAYEYQVLRRARDIVDVGYWLAGTELPAHAQRGNAYVIVDETIADAIASRLGRFMRDLTGDGWQVQRHHVPRGNDKKPIENLKAAQMLKEWLYARYAEDPFGQHAVILVGHVPIMKSGKANPDGHNLVSHATDLFYADMDGRWSATAKGELLNNRLPNDFIEMQIGRIDFSPVSMGKRRDEIRFLRAYFDKNHHWRMGYVGDLRNAYGKVGHLTTEVFSLRNVVGPNNLIAGGHHDVGEEKPWLWGADFGDWKGSRYAEKYSNKAIFTINFGSGKQKFDTDFNPMTALLAQPWYPLTVGWGGRPAWWLHHMALGGLIGDVHMRTVNNGRTSEPYRKTMDYFPTGRYLWRNPVWVNLLGDPTLHAFPLAPASSVTVESVSNGVKLSWLPSPDPDTIGYQIFRTTPNSKGFTILNGPDPVKELTFTDVRPVQNARYMVRAYGLKQVYAGSFYTLSQGAYSTNNIDLETSPTADMEITGRTGQSVKLSEAFNKIIDDKIYALIEDPVLGRLEHEEAGWVFIPPTGFTGAVNLRFSVSDTWRTKVAVLKITVGN